MAGPVVPALRRFSTGMAGGLVVDSAAQGGLATACQILARPTGQGTDSSWAKLQTLLSLHNASKITKVGK
jgi:hypothetical protein